jgi:hypothetical protein
MSRIRRIPSPGLIVAVLALAVALGGVAIAAPLKIGKNKVGAKQLKPVTVRTLNSPEFPAGQLANNGNADRRSVTITCNPGEIATSGGLYWNQGDEAEVTGLSTGEVRPIVIRGEPVGYTVVGLSDENPSPGSPPIAFTAYAECLKK